MAERARWLRNDRLVPKIALGKAGAGRLLLAAASLAVVVGGLVVGLSPGRSDAADHLDGPMVKQDGRLDINDVYAFQSPSNSANTVLIMTVDPLAGVLSPTTFHPNATYDLKIANGSAAVESKTFSLSFAPPDRAGRQVVTLRCAPVFSCLFPGGLPNGGVGQDRAKAALNQRGSTILAKGLTGSNIPVLGGGVLRADLFDDPFFFDLAAFRNGLAFCPGGKGTNFFTGLNTAAIVLELPSASVGTQIGVWGRTERGQQQIDRMARPAINTVFMHTDAEKDKFNSGIPANDRRDFRATVVHVLRDELGNSQTRADALADFLLPDILTVDTSSSAGFPNGRRLADDVIDVELNLITNGAVTTDCVGNDSPFTNAFPYLAPPNK
jgi:hypothetical protein